MIFLFCVFGMEFAYYNFKLENLIICRTMEVFCMENNQNVVITMDFDGITKWQVSSNEENDESHYSVDL